MERSSPVQASIPSDPRIDPTLERARGQIVLEGPDGSIGRPLVVREEFDVPSVRSHGGTQQRPVRGGQAEALVAPRSPGTVGEGVEHRGYRGAAARASKDASGMRTMRLSASMGSRSKRSPGNVGEPRG
ncbi:MAG: hypothetical protein HC888_17535 [Candidatus Competibacteraceae bacterium]|nr:hypothetical protein [Candidatus Competibacteraceae bacterium]